MVPLADNPGLAIRTDWPQFDCGGPKSYEVEDLGQVHQCFGGVEAFEQISFGFYTLAKRKRLDAAATLELVAYFF